MKPAYSAINKMRKLRRMADRLDELGLGDQAKRLTMTADRYGQQLNARIRAINLTGADQ